MYTAYTDNIHIQHKFNGRERQLGQKNSRVDGWCAVTSTVYQFHGCLFHGHENCPLTRGVSVNPFNHKPLAQLRQATDRITRYLREQVGVTVIELWECQWQKAKRQNPSIKQFLELYLPQQTPFKGMSPITEDKILRCVRNNTLFGLVRCDLSVPPHLHNHFSEFQPIFKNVMVGRDDIGPFNHHDKVFSLRWGNRTVY